MKQNTNEGYDLKIIDQYQSKISASGRNYLLDETDEHNDECAHFYFIGKHDQASVVFDCVLYTLRFQHESELFEIAEQKAAQHFPQYKRIQYEEDETGNLKPLDDFEEEIGLYMAEVMVELEEEGEVKVMEHVDLDLSHEFGIGIDAGLNVEVITPELIERFINDFNLDTLKLDTGLYSFQMNNDNFED